MNNNIIIINISIDGFSFSGKSKRNIIRKVPKQEEEKEMEIFRKYQHIFIKKSFRKLRKHFTLIPFLLKELSPFSKKLSVSV